MLMRSSFHCLSSAPSSIAVPGCSRSLSTNPSSDIDMYKMTSRMTCLPSALFRQVTVVEQHPGLPAQTDIVLCLCGLFRRTF